MSPAALAPPLGPPFAGRGPIPQLPWEPFSMSSIL
jgi:hypothetical protein